MKSNRPTIKMMKVRGSQPVFCITSRGWAVTTINKSAHTNKKHLWIVRKSQSALTGPEIANAFNSREERNKNKKMEKFKPASLGWNLSGSIGKKLGCYPPFRCPRGNPLKTHRIFTVKVNYNSYARQTDRTTAVHTKDVERVSKNTGTQRTVRVLSGICCCCGALVLFRPWYI